VISDRAAVFHHAGRQEQSAARSFVTMGQSDPPDHSWAPPPSMSFVVLRGLPEVYGVYARLLPGRAPPPITSICGFPLTTTRLPAISARALGNWALLVQVLVAGS
jgi:hypothetical protein